MNNQIQITYTPALGRSPAVVRVTGPYRCASRTEVSRAICALLGTEDLVAHRVGEAIEFRGRKV